MHMHGTSQVAQKCSRFCAQNYADTAYWKRHFHVRDYAPVTGCYECKQDEKRIEEARLTQLAWEARIAAA
jgi:hypothetical protein